MRKLNIFGILAVSIFTTLPSFADLNCNLNSYSDAASNSMTAELKRLIVRAMQPHEEGFNESQVHLRVKIGDSESSFSTVVRPYLAEQSITLQSGVVLIIGIIDNERPYSNLGNSNTWATSEGRGLNVDPYSGQYSSGSC